MTSNHIECITHKCIVGTKHGFSESNSLYNIKIKIINFIQLTVHIIFYQIIIHDMFGWAPYYYSFVELK